MVRTLWNVCGGPMRADSLIRRIFLEECSMNAKSIITLAALAGCAMTTAALATDGVLPLAGTIKELRDAGAIKVYYYNLATGERTLIKNGDVAAASGNTRAASERFVFNNISLGGVDGGWGALPNLNETVAPASICANSFVDGFLFGYATQITEPDTNGIPDNDVTIRFYDADQGRNSPNAALVAGITITDINGKDATQTTAGVYYLVDLTTIGAEFELADNDGADFNGNPVGATAEDIDGTGYGNIAIGVQFNNANLTLTGSQGVLFEGGSFAHTSEVDSAGIGGLITNSVPGIMSGFGQKTYFDLFTGTGGASRAGFINTYRWSDYSYTFPSICLFGPTGNDNFLAATTWSGTQFDPSNTYLVPTMAHNFSALLAFFASQDTLSN